jgi:dienelactone hydrolase
MKNKKEPALELLTIEPDKKITIKENGFHGWLYQPKENAYPGKALIMMGGSDGYFSLTCYVAEQFVKRGITVLALAYWNQPGLPDAFENVPIEPVEKAAQYLKTCGIQKVGLWGISMGAELALIAGSLFQDLISCVVAACPINVCSQGFASGKGVTPLEDAAYSYQGKGLPFANLSFSKKRILKDMLKYREVRINSCYEDVVENAPEEARIKVENIKGPILLLSAAQDAMWPAKDAGEAIMKRLAEKKFPYTYKHYNYEYASHFLIPVKLKSARMFAIERKYPEKCWESDMDAFEKTLEFLKEW